MDRAIFIPCHYDGLPRSAGSARIRCEWVAKYWDRAVVFDSTQRLPEFKLMIFQKVYKGSWATQQINAVERWRDVGWCKMALDLCDPDFLDDEHRQRLMRVIHKFDFAVASTRPLADWLARYLPAYVVADRVDFEELGGIKKRVRLTRRPRLVWFGYSRNAVALDVLRDEIDALGWPLTIVAEMMPERWKDRARFVQWDRMLVNSEIVRADVVLNPAADRPEWRYKSDNKTGHAMALGMPVVTGPGQLSALKSVRERARIGEQNLASARRLYDVRESAREWERIFDEWVNGGGGSE